MRWTFLVGGLLLAASNSWANDTTAELTTGGLIYVQTTDVVMEEEDLYLSREEVLVDYVFRNTSEKEVESIIAFPMPDVVGGAQNDVAVGDMESDNFLGFSVVQDSRQIKPELQQRVLALGIDRTDEFETHKIPVLPYSDKTAEALKALPVDVKADWISKGLIYVDSYDAGQGWEEEIRPAWTLRSTYWWKTSFPPNKPVRVSHRYKPSVGGTVAMTFIEGGKPVSNYKAYAERYCIDSAFMKTAARLEAAAAKSGPHYTEQWISYILTTGANWSGPIGKFKLTVDKGREKDFVSFCGTGVKKVGPTTFEMSATDFYPQKDLHVLFLNAVE
ncbi:DUF4424 domain-containing protein [Rhizobium sp. NTR19]|uniref:DUF4424 domain-containing protein n=1 Tax=Neorhizobium turbinariae TaxID=2937795 RepID=A0ABT0IS30_9HYPH|nr:DUF4424 domain-containing protein [Neorhizobium turbinariae]MCK8780667.1 DUF4424 domain-containing protein [Neorhizobium turbinariae]